MKDIPNDGKPHLLSISYDGKTTKGYIDGEFAGEVTGEVFGNVDQPESTWCYPNDDATFCKVVKNGDTLTKFRVDYETGNEVQVELGEKERMFLCRHEITPDLKQAYVVDDSAKTDPPRTI